MQLVVPIAVKNAVSAATITFTASSMIRCFFIVYLLSALVWYLFLPLSSCVPSVASEQSSSEGEPEGG